MTTEPNQSAAYKHPIIAAMAMLLQELKQYGIAAIVMLICMAALGWIFLYFEKVRESKDSELRGVNDKVFTAFVDNKEALNRSTESQEKTVKALDDLRAEIRSNRN